MEGVGSTSTTRLCIAAAKLGLMGVAITAAGCGPSGPRLEVFYSDDVVGAPTRTISITALAGTRCEQVLSVQHTDTASVGTVVGQRVTGYPIDPDEDVLSDFPGDVDVALDITALGRSGLRVARSCRNVRLNSQDKLQIELLSLPSCKSPPAELDVMIVLDTSGTVAIADPMGFRGPAIVDEIINQMTVPAWGLVTYGHENLAVERVRETADRAEMRTGLLQAGALSEGTSQLFAGLTKGAELLRARSVCGRLPVLLMVSGQKDESRDGSFQEASTALYSIPSYTEDDLYVFAIGMSEVAIPDLTAVIEDSQGWVTLATSDLQIRAALGLARRTFLSFKSR
jgi:hypothetical protein